MCWWGMANTKTDKSSYNKSISCKIYVLGFPLLVHKLWASFYGSRYDIDGLAQDYMNSSALAMELRQYCT